MSPHVSTVLHLCTIPQSALQILEPIADRFVLPMVWRISTPQRNPIHARITAYDGKLENVAPQQPLTPTTASNPATIKLP